jgi:hypothetical protein
MKYKHKRSGEIVEISKPDKYGIYMVNPTKIIDTHPTTGKMVECIECDDLVDTKQLKQQYEPIN